MFLNNVRTASKLLHFANLSFRSRKKMDERNAIYYSSRQMIDNKLFQRDNISDGSARSSNKSCICNLVIEGASASRLDREYSSILIVLMSQKMLLYTFKAGNIL